MSYSFWRNINCSAFHTSERIPFFSNRIIWLPSDTKKFPRIIFSFPSLSSVFLPSKQSVSSSFRYVNEMCNEHSHCMSLYVVSWVFVKSSTMNRNLISNQFHKLSFKLGTLRTFNLALKIYCNYDLHKNLRSHAKITFAIMNIIWEYKMLSMKPSSHFVIKWNCAINKILD